MGSKAKVNRGNFDMIKTVALSKMPSEEKSRIAAIYGISQPTMSKVGRCKDYDEYRRSINGHFEDWKEAKQEWQNLDMQEKKEDGR